MRRAEWRGRAMGSSAQVVVWSAAHADRLAELAAERIALLEECWSRFRPGSELSRLNARAGTGPVPASPDLVQLVRTMVDAARWTDGVVDASVLGAVSAAGYDGDFATVRWIGRPVAATPSPPVPSLAGVDVDADAGLIRLPPGVGLDPGGIGKGLAAQLVSDEIAAAGAHGVLVCLGGDVVVHGVPPDSPDWRVAVHDDRRRPATTLTVIGLAPPDRAVATSSTLKRRLRHGHHVIDPATGRPATSDVAQATVIAPHGWQAEAAATAAIVRGSSWARAWLEDRSLTGYLLPHEPSAPAWTAPERVHA